MALADIDKLLDQLTLPITDCMVIPDDDPSLKLLRNVPKKRIFGRSLKANVPIKLTPAGGFSLGSEGSSLPAGVQSTSNEGNVGVKKLFMSLDFTDEQMRAMEGGRERLHTTFEEELNDAMRAFKARQICLFTGGRGDGVVGRVDGSTTTETTVTCSTPILAVEGDKIESFSKRDTNTRSGNDISTAIQVVGVNQEAGTIEFDGAAYVDDNHLLALSPEVDQSSTRYKWPMGLMGIVDNPKGLGTTVMYDADDTLDTTNDHVDTLLGLTRANVFKTNCISFDANSAVLDEYYLALGAALAQGAGAKVSRLVYLMNPKMYRRILKYFAGLMRPQGETIRLPGGNERLPVITTGGAGQMPIIQSYYIPDGVYLCVGMDDFEQFTVPGDWVKQGGSRQLLIPDGSGSYEHKYRFTFAAYWNTFSRYPFRQVCVYNFSTSL
jgi:hypothetical protein